MNQFMNLFNESQCTRKDNSQKDCYNSCTEECEINCNIYGEGTEEEEICDRNCEKSMQRRV